MIAVQSYENEEKSFGPCPLRTVEREVPDALDVLSRAFLESGLIKHVRVPR
jgi:hypothetical protein